MTDVGSTSLNRAIAILKLLGSQHCVAADGLGVVQIARLVGRDKSQVSRSLKTLSEAGLVARHPETQRFTLGWRLFTLAAGAASQHLLSLAPQVLRKLVARVGESAHLTVLEGREVLTVMSESPARVIQAAPWVGRAAPLHCTSSGRALLFNHTDSEIRGLLGDADFAAAGPRGPCDVDDMLSRLRLDRQTGWVNVIEEFEPGLVAVAAPVKDFRGHTAAALNISAPKFRLGRALSVAGREVKAAADHLTKALTAAPAEERTTPVTRTSNTRRIS